MKETNEENIIDVQKNYSEEIIQEIQNALDNETAIVKILSSIDELPKIIYIDNVKMVLTHNNNSYDSCLFIDALMNKSDTTKWKTEPIWVFYHKDWKRLNKNINIFENNNYIELTFNVKDAEVNVLLRRVDIELADNTFALMEYGEVYYNNAHYAIIKAFSPTINESYSTKSMLENNNYTEKMFDNYGTEIIFNADGKRINTEPENENPMSVNDITDPESEELF